MDDWDCSMMIQYFFELLQKAAVSSPVAKISKGCAAASTQAVNDHHVFKLPHTRTSSYFRLLK